MFALSEYGHLHLRELGSGFLASRFPDTEESCNKDLFDSLADLLSLVGSERFFASFSSFLRTRLDIEALLIFEFNKSLQPRLLHSKGVRHDRDLRKYLGGLYLLDPYFDLYENQDITGIYRFNDNSADELEATEQYKKYWRDLDLDCEIGGLYEIESGRCLHVSLMFNERPERPVDQVIAFMKASEQLCLALLTMHDKATTHPDQDDKHIRRQVHKAVQEKLTNFGSGDLSVREREVLMLLLKGQSAKAIANRLSIAPGTASVHRSSVYQKLGVMTQGELFSLFLAELTES